MRETRTKTIDGLTFRVQMLDGWRGQKLSTRLLRMLGPALLQAGSGVDSKAMKPGASLADMDIGPLLGGLSGALEKLLTSFSEHDLEQLTKEVLEGATVQDGSKEMPVLSVYADIMAGKPFLGFKLLGFALETNLGDFGPALAGLLRQVQARVPSSKESTTSPTPGPVSG